MQQRQALSCVHFTATNHSAGAAAARSQHSHGEDKAISQEGQQERQSALLALLPVQCMGLQLPRH